MPIRVKNIKILEFKKVNVCVSGMMKSLTHAYLLNLFARDFEKSLTCWGQAQSAVSLANCFSVKKSQVLYLVSG